MSRVFGPSQGVRAAVAGTLMLALSACAVGPEFQRPAVPTVDHYGEKTLPTTVGEDGAPPQQLLSGATVPADWWTLFQSPALNSAIEQALANNQNVAAARASVQQAQALVEARTGARYPQLDLDASIGRQKLGSRFLGTFPKPPPFTYYAFGPAVSYTLDYTGGIKRSIEQQLALADYQRQESQATQITVAGNVVLQALSVAAHQAEIDTMEELLADDRKNVEMIQAAFEAGSLNKVDVLIAQSQLANDETLLPPIKKQLGAARNALAVLMGQPPSALGASQLDLAAFTLPAQIPVSLPSDLVHRRPDILAAESQLHAATAAVGVATANLYPRITLTAGFSQESVNTNTLFDSENSAWNLIGNLTAPLFDGGRLRAEKRAAAAALAVQAARYQQVVLESFAQVADALDAVQHSSEQMAAQEKALSVAQENLELTRESLKEGFANVLQVLDSERLYQQARLGHVRAQAQRLADTAQLFVALGGSQP
ncbi:MAG TPA: efflux transporter outer membrane subunit [Povalibacter sp.]|nr:efflux transporter outer membrane subunit [Povalibacter sp.]